MKKNCWEYKKCQREKGGLKANELGVCPASEDDQSDLVNSGINGGRYCWKIAGTLCGGKVQGSFASKLLNCAQCDFFKLVKSEEKSMFQA